MIYNLKMIHSQIGFGGPAKFAGKLVVEFDDKRAAFADFLATYGRSYASKSEIDIRYSIFSKNYEHIQNHNSSPNRGYEKVLN